MTPSSRLTFALLPLLIASTWMTVVQAAPASATPSRVVAQKAALQQVFNKTGVRTRSQLVRVALDRYRDLVV